jgi:hypothetical protein
VHAVLGVGRLGFEAVELVRRVRHVAVRGSLIRLTGSPPAENLVGVVQASPDGCEALMAGVVERPLRLRAPERVLLGDELLDLIEDRLFVHEASIVRTRPLRRSELRASRPALRDPRAAVR